MDGPSSGVVDAAESHAQFHAFAEALESHHDWLWQMQRAVACASADQTPAHGCGLSRWLRDAERNPAIAAGQSFVALVDAHRNVHVAVDALLAAAAAGPIAVESYDRFLHARAEFKTLALALQRALWNQICLVDALTGLRNRHGMLAELREEQQRARRDQCSCVVAMMDIDHFKGVNDRHGHGVGDAILRAVTRLTSRRLRPYDRVYRYGGEEFLICLPQTDLHQATGIIERLREEIASQPIAVEGIELVVTVSFGIAPVVLDGAVEESIRRADQALYVAKENGRNQVIAAQV